MTFPVSRNASPATFPSTIRLQHAMMTELSTDEPVARVAFCERMIRLPETISSLFA